MSPDQFPILVASMEKTPTVRTFKPGQTTTMGLDPSMTSTGYSIIRGDRLIAAGKITTKPSQSEPERLWIIFSEVLDLIREYAVDHVAIEEFTAFYRNRSRSSDPSTLSPASMLMGAGRGRQRRGRHDRDSIDPRSMFLLKAAQTATQVAALLAGCDVFLYKVSEWKGRQNLGKDAIIERAQLLYGVKTRNDNITDAIMIAHHHITHGRMYPDRSFVVPDSELAEVVKRLRSWGRPTSQEVA